MSEGQPSSEGPRRYDFDDWDTSLGLEEEGVRIARPVSLRRSLLIPYDDVTHLAVGPRGISIGTHSGITLLRRGKFKDPSEGPEALRDAILLRISRGGRGLETLARFAEIDQLGRQPFRSVAGATVALLCAAVFTLQLIDPFASHAGSFIPGLVEQGELWRVLTANFFHSNAELPLHLLVNLIALLFLTVLVERPLGPLRAAVVMGASGVGAMGASALAGYMGVTGASGIVFGLVGAALCLELHYPDRLPVWWRLPRSLVYAVLLWEASVALFVPFIAGAAHLGGFVAGYFATRLVAGSALVRGPTPGWVSVTAGGFALATLLSFVAAGALILGDSRALERYGRDLLASERVPAENLNALAWRIATEGEPSLEQLALAEALAERAVAEADRGNPEWLDTLAEVLFVQGERERALSVIDEAITLAPGVEYFLEQRRRFQGERARDDRPVPYRHPWPFYPPPPPGESVAPDPGIEV